MAKLSKTLDMMVGSHLNAHVMGRLFPLDFFTRLTHRQILGGYEFLMQNCTWDFLNSVLTY